MIKCLIWLLLTVFLVGCSEKASTEAREAAPLTVFKAGKNHIRFLEERFISLTADTGHLPGEITQFQFFDDTIYLLDGFNTYQAYVFDGLGRLIKRVGGPGPGPGEYRHPGGFCRSGNRLHLAGSGRKYIVYDENGDFLSENREVHPGGIAQNIYPGKDSSAYLTCYSRHVPDASIYHINQHGLLLNKFSGLDSDFVHFWDQLVPSGHLVVSEDRLMHVFSHKYEINIFDLDGKRVDTFPLASAIYHLPDYAEAKQLALERNRKRLLAFKDKYSLIIGFSKLGDYYVTAISNTHAQGKDVLEYWDEFLRGVGRCPIPDGERFIGAVNDELVFHDTEKDRLIFRTVAF